MTSPIAVILRVPVLTGGLVDGVMFRKWLPDPSDEIAIERDGLTARLTIAREDMIHSNHHRGDGLTGDPFLAVTHVRVRVDVAQVEDDLVEHIMSEPVNFAVDEEAAHSQDTTRRLHFQFVTLAERVLAVSIEGYNRFVGHVRTTKHQHWLRQRSTAPWGAQWSVFAATVIDEGGRAATCNPQRSRWSRIVAPVRNGITQEDWPSIISAAYDGSRPDLVRELLANSMYLAEIRLLRSALIEAVSALEVAVTRFGANPRTDLLTRQHDRGQIQSEPLARVLERLGLTASLSCLIPLLVPATMISDEVLQRCVGGVQMRHALVHSGSRRVNEDTVWPMLSAIYRVAAVMQELTGAPQAD